MATFMIEGEWSGYRSGQRRVVHREYTKRKARADAVSNLGFIQYTDGTTLSLSVKPVAGRKREREIDGYSVLIQKCLDQGVNHVSALKEK